MTTIVNSTSTGYVAQSNDEFLLEAGSTLSHANLTAFHASGQALAGFNFLVAGTIEDAGYGIGIMNGATTGSTVHVGQTGSIDAKYAGISLEGAGGTVENEGAINGGSWAVRIEGSQNSVLNEGDIAGTIAIKGDGNSVVNHGTISAAGTCFDISLNAGEKFTLVNDGFITSAKYCLASGSGDTSILNRGTMEGWILLGDGADIFRNKGGTIIGSIYGDDGDDTFAIDRKSIKIVEWDGEGDDTIRSSASFTLSDNVETGILTGRRNLSLTGTAADDDLIGNRGDNRLFGGEGSDRIVAGRGDDILSGGEKAAAMDGAADVFVFAAHSGDDRIVGFEAGIDHIDLSGYAGVDDFRDLHGRIHQVGDDVVVSLMDGDEITLRDILKADVGKDDFVF